MDDRWQHGQLVSASATVSARTLVHPSSVTATTTTTSSRVLVCGAKGTGKSVFARQLLADDSIVSVITDPRDITGREYTGASLVIDIPDWEFCASEDSEEFVQHLYDLLCPAVEDCGASVSKIVLVCQDYTALCSAVRQCFRTVYQARTCDTEVLRQLFKDYLPVAADCSSSTAVSKTEANINVWSWEAFCRFMWPRPNSSRSPNELFVHLRRRATSVGTPPSPPVLPTRHRSVASSSKSGTAKLSRSSSAAGNVVVSLQDLKTIRSELTTTLCKINKMIDSMSYGQGK